MRSCMTATPDARPRASSTCGYGPMVELLRYLEANGFTNYIASGGDRDFMRPVTERRSTASRPSASSAAPRAAYSEDEHGGTIAYQAEPDFFDDGPAKPVRIWSRIGRRPILAVGNSNGDIPMLRYAGGKDRPALRLLLLHDDAEREFDYTAGAEEALELAADAGLDRRQHQERLDRVFELVAPSPSARRRCRLDGPDGPDGPAIR